MKTHLALLTFVCLSLFTACGAGSLGPGVSSSSPSLRSIQVAPSQPSVSLGQNQQFTATGHYSDGSTKDLTNSATWASSNTSIATISTSGLATSRATGSATISATLSGVTGNGSITVTAVAPTLQSIQVAPSTASIALGQNQQFTATGHYSDGSTKDLTSSAAWASSNTSIATISASGLAASRATGSATISATLSGVTGNASLTVTAAALVSISISPSTTSVVAGKTAQFTATGTFTDGTQRDITSTVNWASSNVAVASINAGGVAGLAKGLSPGVSTISASSGNISSTATLTVTNATLVSIAVTPANAVLFLGTLQQFTATGTFSDGSSQDITGAVTWASSDTTVASITAAGMATALTLGSATISATSNSITGSTTVNVVPAVLSSITIRPANKKIAKLTSQQFQAIGKYTDGSTRNITGKVTWASSNTTVATISSRGLAKALTPGSTTITATLGSISASATLDVSNATVVSIAVTPAGRTIAEGTKLSFTARGRFNDGTTQVITTESAWASDNPAVATMGGVSTATGVGPGTAHISATFEGITGSSPLNVTAATLTSIAVTPASAVMAPTTSLDCVATGTFSDGSTQVITGIVTWISSAPTVASVGGGGRVTAESAGSATITAQLDSLSGESSILVDSSPLTSIQISPPTASTPQQTEVTFVAIGHFADGNTQDLTTSALWTSTPASVASVSDVPPTIGHATGLAPGTATITALFGGQVGTASLTVTTAAATSLTLLPADANLEQDGFIQFRALADFTDGTTRDVTRWVSWTSSSSSVAAVMSTGIATGSHTGTTTVTATINGLSGTAVLTVH